LSVRHVFLLWQAVLPVGKVFGAGFGRCGAYRQGDRSGIRPGSLLLTELLGVAGGQVKNVGHAVDG
jgi:hypothetical protein